MALGYALAIVLCGATLLSEAQPTRRGARIGFIATTPAPYLIDAVLDELRTRGWIERRNLFVEQRYSEGRADRFPELAADLVRLNVDVIITSGTPATLAASKATSTIPIVMAAVMDPISVGLVRSLAQPGGNVTGMSWLGPELGAKRIALLEEAFPGVSRVAVIANPANPAHAVAVKEMQSAAARSRISLHLYDVRIPDDFTAVFAAMAKHPPGALVTVSDPLTYRERARIVDFATKQRLPAIYEWREFTEIGGLMAYGGNLTDLFRHAAVYVDKILKGAKPAQLPVEQVTKFELVINARTAKALGISLPPALLMRADQIIE